MKKNIFPILLILLSQINLSASQISKVEKHWESATESVHNMHVGWNLGNTLDTHKKLQSNNTIDFETGWGQPVTTIAMIKKFKAAGFNVIRVPVTWYQHLDENDNIDEAWMKRVEEVVNYVLDSKMYCILNVHHDTGVGQWICADYDKYPLISIRYKKIWQQIATRFKKYDKHLIFEAYNEMLDKDNSWKGSKYDGAYKTVNALAQDFVNVVRATGGNNTYRNLCVNTYASGHTPITLANFKLPSDKVKNHLMVQVHDYSPHVFAQKKDGEKIFTDQFAHEISKSMKELGEFSHRINAPVIIGEFGCTAPRDMNEIVKHAKCVVSEAAKNDIVCIKWMGLLDRRTLKWSEPELTKAIIDSAKLLKK